MEDKWISLKQTEGERQAVYIRVDAISALAPAGPGSRIWVHGTPVLVEETPQQILQKLKAPKPLMGRKGEGE
jgi:hypothetical protein